MSEALLLAWAWLRPWAQAWGGMQRQRQHARRGAAATHPSMQTHQRNCRIISISSCSMGGLLIAAASALERQQSGLLAALGQQPLPRHVFWV